MGFWVPFCTADGEGGAWCCFSGLLGFRWGSGFLSVQLKKEGEGQVDISAQLGGKVGVSFHYIWGQKVL